MASSTRVAMRLLSPRIQCLQRPARCATQIRHASRYSNPAKRSFTAAPAAAPSFVAQSALPPHIYAEQDAVRNPLDARAAQLAHEEKRQYHIRRMRFAGIGLLLSIFGLAMVLYNLDLDDMEQAELKRKNKQQLDASDDSNKQFQGKEVEIIGAGEDKRIVARGPGGEVELVETGTSSVPHFPRTIHLPTSPESAPAKAAAGTDVPGLNEGTNAGNIQNQEEYTLLGLGIRTVSFLGIQVYVVGMYIRTQDISALQEKLIHVINESASTLIPSEKEELKKRLLDPSGSREIWQELLKVPGLKTAWRVAPTRNTDFGHLRDGWITGITNRTREAKQLAKGVETEYDAEDFGQAIGSFKSLFAGGKAPKGSVMILARGTTGNMDVWFQAKPGASGKDKQMQLLGTVPDERISKLIWLGYLGGDKVSSEAARQGVVDGCIGFAGRPIGSAEARVV
ncbi:Altered inheritance of mitochondria protein 18, mitochondrial [Fulvia fulva]|uniref:Altered inheritance of mitochondria protein 18, mitochondrial n=1 Tax=Passalora fulva TaxID=5499 RepID=A0A9Q8L5Y1_PASFU|nr:Altered inheritance of mitochondria protein 18, mitochondrial [Fulvia fulva]KAK4637592.1 Altered inheritance of mitochondria protein 18, mitochondrial [Fulvia fulva]UJO11334.1 Altered inheritance of mitochondria protein 18, mitochondrial [Fulvia fulva]